MDKELRLIKEEDFAELISLFKEFAVFEKLPQKMTNSVEQMKTEKEFVNGFVVRDKGKIVGYVTFFFAYYTWTGKSLYMDDLYVVPDYRGQGLGSLLVDGVISFAKEHKCKKLRWQVSSWNDPAIEFYEGIGAEINKIDMNCDLIL